MCITINEKVHNSVCGTGNMRMTECENSYSSGLRVDVMPYLRDRGDRDYVLMLKSLIRDS